ncbi:MAG: type II secretion system major pseudopilin GspG [Gammaproteobacteria bacterium]|jgi:general secretion pathway protein G|nr:type II secretion system major pseudopilin GspG [Gammaproteobacteria bacterium]MBT4493330.1 type II secretion system major pseudopilin GspG [Gammaproteobacteria bacterium]MBT7372032.1 type II secretion system major pseudopilin GspG [Gammaproteobacteria bacterium]
MRVANQGFTLIEIMVVVVILGILSALIVPNMMARPDEARVTAARLAVQEIGKALEFYRLDNGFYPSTDQGIEALVSEPSGFPEPRNWSPEGYLKNVPEDPWGEPYLYFNEDRTVDVYSFGADRQEGGESVDADIRLSEL